MVSVSRKAIRESPMEGHIGDRRHDFVPSQTVESKRHYCRTSRPSMAWATAQGQRLRVARKLVSATSPRSNSAAFIHACDPCPVSSTSTSTARLLVLLISISSSFLDMLINVSWFTEGPEGKNQPAMIAGKSSSIKALRSPLSEAYQATETT